MLGLWTHLLVALLLRTDDQDKHTPFSGRLLAWGKVNSQLTSPLMLREERDEPRSGGPKIGTRTGKVGPGCSVFGNSGGISGLWDPYPRQ